MRTDRGKNCSGPCLLCLLNQEDCCVASLISIEGDPSADEYSQIDLPSLHEMERTNYHKGLKRELTTGEWSAIKDVIDRSERESTMLKEGKKYTLKLEAEALSYREILSVLIDVLGDINANEKTIKESGFTMSSSYSTGCKYHFDIRWENWDE